jgi:hypothetical protein
MPDQSESYRQKDGEFSALRVSSARDMLELFPEMPDVTWLFQSTPRWSMLRSLLQAGAILALEIMFNFIHVSGQTEEIANDAEKVLR